ncbi:MAG TPA: hypothetical protein VFA07_11695 [Chthonomonadaceae bacterium]|nr:hypothetical protein [Chthonomonadaceae bacterium]
MPPPAVPAGEILLERYAEPYAAIAWRLGRPYPTAALDVLRQRLLHTTPTAALEICEQIVQESLAAIAGQIDTTVPLSPSTTDPTKPVKPLAPDPLCALIVFNPLAWPRTEEVEIVVSLPAESAPPEGKVAVRGAQADAAPCSVMPQHDPAGPVVARWHVRFPAAVPAFGYQTFFLTPEAPVVFPPVVLPAECRLEAEGEWAGVRARQDEESSKAPLRAVQTGLHAGPLPKSHAFFRTEPEALFPTTLRQSEDGQALLFSAVNYGTSPVRPVLKLSEHLLLREPVRVLSEEERAPAEEGLLPPGQTVTWRLETGGNRA